MERSEITFPQLEEKIRQLVADNPTYVYPKLRTALHSCVYNATETQPQCIFGRAFTELGFPLPARYEGKNILAILRKVIVGPYSYRDEQWAQAMQVGQDRGLTWRHALEQADVTRSQIYVGEVN